MQGCSLIFTHFEICLFVVSDLFTRWSQTDLSCFHFSFNSDLHLHVHVFN